MRILGVDFTSAPSRRKPITCLRCRHSSNRLTAEYLEAFSSFRSFEDWLGKPGPWIAGIDFPFGQARRFVETTGWPQNWSEYVQYAGSLGREAFREALTQYRDRRPFGDKEHRRRTDIVAKSVSPQKLHGVPVGLMFYEGVPRLIEAGVTIPHLQDGDPKRIVVEAYPGIVARHFIGRRSYKNDTKRKQTAELQAARADLFDRVIAECRERYGFEVEAPRELIDDPTGDQLDALLCAIQAAWAWQNREDDYGAPKDVDPLEGWIADPAVREGYPPQQQAPVGREHQQSITTPGSQGSRSRDTKLTSRTPEEAELLEHALTLLGIAGEDGRTSAALSIDVACYFIQQAIGRVQSSRPSGVKKSIEDILVRAKALRAAFQNLDEIAWLQLSRHGLNAILTVKEDMPETALGLIARGEKPKFMEQLDRLIELSEAALADVPVDKGGGPRPLAGLTAKQQAAAWCCHIAAKHSSLAPSYTAGSAFLEFVATVWELATGEVSVNLERPVKEYLREKH